MFLTNLTSLFILIDSPPTHTHSLTKTFTRCTQAESTASYPRQQLELNVFSHVLRDSDVFVMHNCCKRGKQGQFLSKHRDRCFYDYECVTVENVGWMVEYVCVHG